MTRAIPATALAATALAAAPTDAQGPAQVVRQASAGPCNMVTVNINAADLQRGIFNGFEVQPTGSIGTLVVKQIDTHVTVEISTGNLVCTSSGSTSQVGWPHRAQRSRRVPVVHGKARIVLDTTDSERDSIQISPRVRRAP